MNFFRRLRDCAAGAAAVLLAGFAHAAEPLRVGMVPDAGATQVSVEDKAPLQKYLEHVLGRPVQLIIPTNYNATVEGIGNGSLDIAYFGGLTYVKAHGRYGAIPLVQRDEDQQFHSLFIARSGSGINSLKDLKGKTFCFGDINSTSGHLYPVLAMKQGGLSPETSLKSFRYTGSHVATAEAVAAGACDAGALDETVYRSLVADGKLPAGGVKVIFTTRPFADYVWAARKGLSAADQKAFADALLRLQPGRDGAILAILRGKRFVRANDAEYADVARTAKVLGLL
jgi:phosphonate transport system substrate-binding protein